MSLLNESFKINFVPPSIIFESARAQIERRFRLLTGRLAHDRGSQTVAIYTLRHINAPLAAYCIPPGETKYSTEP